MDNPYPPASFSPAPGAQPPPPVVKRKPLSFWLALFFGGCSALAALVILVMFVTMGSAPGLGSRGPEGFQEQVVEGSGRDRIVWIPIHGVLLHSEGGGFLPKPDLIEGTIQALKQAGEDARVKAVILDVDSPGGGITESDRIHHAVEQLRSKGRKVVVLMGDVAASGGYYVSAGADHILSHPTTITGSIGVISQFMNFEGLCEKIGVKPETVKSVKFKDIGSGTRPMTPEDRALFQSLVDTMHRKFAGIVLDGRSHVRLPDGRAFDEGHVKTVADGRIYTADEALANGLIDEIGYRDEAIAAAKRLGGLKDATVVEYVRRPGLFDLLGVRAPVSAPAISLDLKSVREILSPRLLFLWTAP